MSLSFENNSYELNLTQIEVPNEYAMDDISQVKMTDMVVYSVLLYIGVCTNIWMLWCLYKTWETGSRAHFYLLAICIADITGLCIRCSIDIATAATEHLMAGGGILRCNVLIAIYWFGIRLAHLLLGGFNLDNVITIVRRRSYKAVRVTVLTCALMLTVLSCVFDGFRLKTVVSGPYVFCSTNHDSVLNKHSVSGLTGMVALLWLPLLTIIFCGGPALCVWCRKKDAINYPKMNEGEDPSAEMKTIGRDIGIASVYNILLVLCWTPMLAVVVMYLFFGSFAHAPLSSIEYIMVANSCFNPVIYGIFTCIYKCREKGSPGL